MRRTWKDRFERNWPRHLNRNLWIFSCPWGAYIAGYQLVIILSVVILVIRELDNSWGLSVVLLRINSTRTTLDIEIGITFRLLFSARMAEVTAKDLGIKCPSGNTLVIRKSDKREMSYLRHLRNRYGRTAPHIWLEVTESRAFLLLETEGEEPLLLVFRQIYSRHGEEANQENFVIILTKINVNNKK